MNLATRKYNLIQELTTIDESLLEKTRRKSSSYCEEIKKSYKFSNFVL